MVKVVRNVIYQKVKLLLKSILLIIILIMKYKNLLTIAKIFKNKEARDGFNPTFDTYKRHDFNTEEFNAEIALSIGSICITMPASPPKG